MQRTTILFLLVATVLGGCRRRVEVGSPPPPAQTPAQSNAPGGATPREAVERFMSAAKVQNLDAMSNVWGTSAGPVRNTMSRQEWEMREVVFMRCLRHDSWRITGEAPGLAGERVLVVELKYQGLTRSTNFNATPGPDGRWFVKAVDTPSLQSICERPL